MEREFRTMIDDDRWSKMVGNGWRWWGMVVDGGVWLGMVDERW
jgi:hypothetical protein